MDNERLSRQVEDDLQPLFARVGPVADSESDPLILPTTAPQARERSLKPLFGGVVAATLIGVAVGALLSPPRPAATSLAKPAAKAAPVETRLLSIQTRDAELPAPEAAPMQARGASTQPAPSQLRPPATAAEPGLRLATAQPGRIATVEPGVVSPRRAAPALRDDSRPAAVDLPQGVLGDPAEQRCADDDEECLAYDVAEADRLLAYAYRQAWQARVPNARLRAVQRAWKPGAGYAVDGTNRALLDAYEVRTRDVWGLIDQWEREGGR